MSARSHSRCPRVDAAWLASHSLPALDPKGDKEIRGHVLVIAGDRDMPGAAVLASMAALRAGGGKLTVMTSAQTATGVGIAVPEARLVGGFTASALKALAVDVSDLGAVVIGPGMSAQRGCERLANAAMKLFADTPIILDAAAMAAGLNARRHHATCLLTPHAGELAGLTGWPKERIVAEPEAAATEAAAHWDTHLLLKGSTTVLATPGGLAWRHESQRPGLATSGSGDVLAGAIAGLLARGADLVCACAWATAAHDRCGERLGERIGEVGYLAREIVDEIPCAIADLATGARRHTPTRFA
jgi:hydroxyethylthiazole kinase-like uncharacterized protein yjeF